MTNSPVFQRELLVFARGWHLHAFRWLYGLILFAIAVAPIWSRRDLSSARELESRELTALNYYFFYSIVLAQFVATLILMPALVAGAIAGEKQRRGFDVLLTTCLSSTQIVTGKLAARLCQLVVVLLLSVPVFCILGLNGGIDPRLVAVSFAVILCSGILIASLAILISTFVRRPVTAAILTYVLTFAWLITPFVPDPFALILNGSAWSELGSRAVEFVRATVAFASPIGRLEVRDWQIYSPELLRECAILMAVQLGLSAAFVIAAALALRPIMRLESSGRSRLRLWSFLASRRGLWARRPCGDRPILWKECLKTRPTLIVRLLVGGIVAAIVVFGMPSFVSFWLQSFFEARANGYHSIQPQLSRTHLNVIVRGLAVTLYLLMSLIVCLRASMNFTTERERETWVSLVCTPLDGREILTGKLLGSVWPLRWLALLILVLAILGAVAGAVHPFAVCLTTLEFIVFLGFIALLGTAFSIKSRTSTRAIAGTLITLLFLNGGYLMCCLHAPTQRPLLAPITPLILGVSLATYGEMEHPTGGLDDLVAQVIVSVAVYGVFDLALFWTCSSLYDSVVDRPRKLVT